MPNTHLVLVNIRERVKANLSSIVAEQERAK